MKTAIDRGSIAALETIRPNSHITIKANAAPAYSEFLEFQVASSRYARVQRKRHAAHRFDRLQFGMLDRQGDPFCDPL